MRPRRAEKIRPRGQLLNGRWQKENGENGREDLARFLHSSLTVHRSRITAHGLPVTGHRSLLASGSLLLGNFLVNLRHVERARLLNNAFQAFGRECARLRKQYDVLAQHHDVRDRANAE